MPFTFSHPALVLPLRLLPKKWFSLTALVIGSIIPDFEYFIRMKVLSTFSHTLNGVFRFDLPIGLLLTFIFHLIVRNSLIANLPKFLKQRLQRFKTFDWINYAKRNWLVVIISLLIGIFSHILWDSFTHDNGYFVNLIPGLAVRVHVFGLTFSGYKTFQHLSTLIGAVIILFTILNLPVNKKEVNPISFRYWLTFVILSLIIVFVRTIFGLHLYQVGDILVTGMSAGLISLMITPLLSLGLGDGSLEV